MDELVIGDKKYISSKRAAKETGYAKDYIGQLCREGRVPARLVGRSWYVLESAIHDHRFGSEKVEEIRDDSALSSWDSPRYESAIPEPLPLIKEEEMQIEEASTSVASVSEHLEDAWKAWFERIGTKESEVKTQVEEVAQEEAPMEREEIAQVIPIKAVYTDPPRELLPRNPLKEDFKAEIEEPRAIRSFFWLRLSGGVLSLLVLVTAVLGTGYFDKYILSNRQVSAVAGVILYKK